MELKLEDFAIHKNQHLTIKMNRWGNDEKERQAQEAVKGQQQGMPERHSSEADKQQTIMKISGLWEEDILFAQTRESHEIQRQK